MMQILIAGGWMMLPIVLCSMASVAIILERCWYFRTLGRDSEAHQMISLVEQQKFTDALAIAERRSQPLLRVLASGILKRDHMPEKEMEAAGIAELRLMKRGLPTLDTIITLGPLLGLLGTIIGMIDSFGIMAKSGLGQPHSVTGGVAEALICTAAGIFVAVTTLVPYNWFNSRVEQEAERMEQYATKAEAALSAQRQQPHS